MPAHEWTFLITATTGVILGEVLNMTETEVNIPLSGIPTLSFKVRLDNPKAATLFTFGARIKAYRDGVLRFHGPIMTVELSADRNTQAIAVTAMGTAWYITKRLIGVGTVGGGYKEGITVGSLASPVDRIDIARFLLATANTPAFTGITDISSGHAAASATAFGPVYLMPLSDAITQLATSDTGFDWEIVPCEPVDVGGGAIQTGLFRAEPTFATSSSNIVFEYGDGRGNIVGFSRQITSEDMLNQGFIEYPGFPDTSQSVRSAGDLDSIGTYGLVQGVVDGGEVAWDELRQSLVEAHVAVRKNPRVMLTATFARDSSPTPFDDFYIGDSLRMRAVVNGAALFDDQVRVWGMKFTLDTAGSETVELQLSPDTA